MTAGQLSLFPVAEADDDGPPRGERRTRLHVVPCTRALRDGVVDLCRRRRADPSLLTTAALALVAEMPVPPVEDPGPGTFERVPVVTAGGMRRTRLVRPHLRLWLPGTPDPAAVRVALRTALAFGEGGGLRVVPGTLLEQRETEVVSLREENDRLRAALDRLAFKPIDGGPRTTAQAAWILGFQNEWGLDPRGVTARFRQLALLFHPDTGVLPDPVRMSQLSVARDILARQLKRD